jgi:hypothetical protein
MVNIIENTEQLINILNNYEKGFSFNKFSILQECMKTLGYSKQSILSKRIPAHRYLKVKDGLFSEIIFKRSLSNQYYLVSRTSGYIHETYNDHVKDVINNIPSCIIYSENKDFNKMYFHDANMFSLKHNPYQIVFRNNIRIESYTPHDAFKISSLEIQNGVIIDGTVHFRNAKLAISCIHSIFPETLNFTKEQLSNLDNSLSSVQLAILEMIQI